MPVLGQRITTSQKLVQKQIITHQLIQSIKLMSMPIADLKETIHEEVEKNPALELVREAGEVDAPAESETKIREDQVTETDPFVNSSDPGYQLSARGDPDSKQHFLEGAVYREKSLSDYLIDQLNLMNINASMRSLAERIIWNVDSDGFHRESPKLLANECEVELLDEALDIVQSLEPLGCGCSDWSESLLVQASIRGDAPALFEVFVQHALPLMESKKSDKVRSTLGITHDDWEDLEDYIRVLNPFPGRLHSTGAIPYIIPDLSVCQREGEYVLILNDEVLPVLRVDPAFEKISEEKNMDKKTRKYVRNHSRQARYFINSLAQRDNTLLKAARSIIEFQRNFFTGGPRFLQPLTLKDIAGEIGVHEATVSRITTNKYIQTEWGIFELKYFFTNSISKAGSAGSRVSKVAAKEIIKEILSDTEGSKRISDQKLSDLLAHRGIHLARRTVTKYRKELDIPSLHKR